MASGLILAMPASAHEVKESVKSNVLATFRISILLLKMGGRLREAGFTELSGEILLRNGIQLSRK